MGKKDSAAVQQQIDEQIIEGDTFEIDAYIKQVCDGMVADDNDRRSYINDVRFENGAVPKMFECRVCGLFAYDP